MSALIDEFSAVKSVERFIFKVANKLSRLHPEWLEDLIQEGRLAALVAYRNFDRTKNNKFSTYAFKCIEGKMVRCVSVLSAHVHIPPGGMLECSEKWDLVRRPTEEKIKKFSEKYGYTEKTIQKFIDAHKCSELTELTHAKALNCVEEEVINEISDKELRAAIYAIKSKRQQQMLEFLLQDYDNKPNHFARYANVSPQAAQALYKSAIKSLKEVIKST